MDTAIQKAHERIAFVAKDKESLRAYEMREMALSDFTSGMNFARREGIMEVAKNMKKAGVDAHQIMIFTNLSANDIGKL